MPTKNRQNFFPAENWGQALFQGGLLAAIFLAPLIGGRFDVWAGALIFSWLCLSAVGRLMLRPTRRFPAALPLSTFHLALAALLLVSAASYFSSFSRFATDGELVKLASGALLFWLILQIKVPLAETSKSAPVAALQKTKRETKAKGSAPRREPSPPSSWLATSAVFLLLVAIGLISQDWNFFYGFWQKIVLFPLILLALIFIFFRGRQKPDTLPLWEDALAAGGVVAAYGIYDWLFMRLVLKNTSWDTFSTFFNPNPLAGFLGLVLFLALGAGLYAIARRKASFRQFLFPILIALVLLVALPMTDSKGAWGSVFLAGLVFTALCFARLAISPGKKVWLIFLLLLVTIAAPAGLVLSRPGLKAKAAANLSLQKDSNRVRYLTWQGSLNMAKAHPWLGVGPGAFESGFGRYAIAGYTRRAHQNYLEMAATIGFPGLLCFVWLLGAGIVGLGRAFRRASGPAKFLAAGALSALLVMAFHSLLDYDWYITANQLYFFLAVALGLAAGMNPDTPSASPGPSQRLGRWLVAAFLLVLAIKALTLGGAENEVNQAQQLLAADNVWEAREHLQTAAGLLAGYAKAKWLLGATTSSPSEGLPLLQKAVSALEPTYAPYWLTLGRSQEQAGQGAEAAQSYLKAGELNPQYLKGWLALAELQLRMGKYPEALAAWQKIVQIQGSPAGIYKAIEYEVKTEYADAHYALGVAGLKGFAPGGKAALSDFEQALKVLADYQKYGKELERQRRAIGEGEAGKEADLKLLQAKCYYRLGQFYAANPKAAERQFAAATALIPDIASTILNEDRLWQK